MKKTIILNHVVLRRYLDTSYLISENGNLIYNENTKKYIKQFKNNSGYLITKIKEEGIYMTRSVHRLVICAWYKPSPGEDYTINHIDNNKANNNIMNLEWILHSENLKKALNNGFKPNNFKRKLSDAAIKFIRFLYKNSKMNQEEIALMFNIHRQTVSDITRYHLHKNIK